MVKRMGLGQSLSRVRSEINLWITTMIKSNLIRQARNATVDSRSVFITDLHLSIGS
jgi:hypothetical protein